MAEPARNRTRAATPPRFVTVTNVSDGDDDVQWVVEMHDHHMEQMVTCGFEGCWRHFTRREMREHICSAHMQALLDRFTRLVGGAQSAQ